MLLEIINNGEFQKEYDYYPEALRYGLAIRKKSKHYRQITKLLKEST